jgi:predicted metal-dependent peptidase
MTRPADLFANARSALLIASPFWGVLSLRLAPVEDASIKTMETDGVSIRYNPDFVADLPPAQLRTLVAHETMHCAALHHTRRGSRDPRRWNHACDYAINPLLVDAGFELWDGAFIDQAYAGMSAEEIYAKLPDDAGGGGGFDPGGIGGVTDPPPAGGDDGDPGQPGRPGTGAPSAADLARQEENWTIATAQAEATARAMGIGAGDAARAIRAHLAPKLDWRDILRRYLSAAAKSDFSWSLPNRRHVARGLYLPSLRSETLGPVVIAVDTSGSIDDVTLAGFSAEIGAILDEAAPERIHVVYCDHTVGGTETFEPGDILSLSPKGGGGTAFRPVFDWIAASDIQPVCAVYLTDLDGDEFGAPPDYPVLWVSTGKTRAPFGEVIPLR